MIRLYIIRNVLSFSLFLIAIGLFGQTSGSSVADSIKGLIKVEKSNKRLAFLNDLLAREYLDSSHDSTTKYAKESLLYSEQDGIYEYQVDAWNTLGISSRKIGQFKQALDYHLKALKIAQSHKLSSHYFYTTYSALCLSYTDQGNYTPAIEFGYKALHEVEVQKDTLNVAIVNNNLANIFFEVNNYEKALVHYKKALEIAVQLGNRFGESLITSNIGSVYYQSGNLDSAKNYFDKSLLIATQIEDVEGEATNYLNIGSYYQKKKQYPLAIESFLKAEKVFRELEMEPNLADIYFNMADVYQELGSLQNAKKYGEQSLDIANRIDGLSQKEAAHMVLSQIYEKLGSSSEAYKHYKSYIEIRDSISSNKNRKEQFKAGLEYEYSKRKYADSLDQVLMTKIQAEALQLEKTKTKTQQKFTYLALIGCAILLILAVFIFKGYKDKKKANQIIVLQKSEVEYQKEIIEVKQKEILDSIHYANRIQNTLLAHHDFLDAHFPNNFVLFKPKDIVSGDFYWATSVSKKQYAVDSKGEDLSTASGELFYLAVCDSTGHGVPGAFMSLLNIGFLSEAINEKNISEPHKIFDYVRNRLVNSVSKEGQKDGFDGVLLCFELSATGMGARKAITKITYAAAHNAPILISDSKLHELPKDKMPVGVGEREDEFNLYTIDMKAGDGLYLYTDGFADQFGGPKGKKFKYKQLEDLLLVNATFPLSEQASALQTAFDNWRGNLEQVDDVCVIGIRF